jgi:hypothetical protein
MAGGRVNPLQGCVDELARDVGRLSRRLDGEGYDGFLISRISGHVETLDAITQPTAHDLYLDNLTYGVDEDEAVAEALAAVDARIRELHSLLATERKRQEATLRAA